MLLWGYLECLSIFVVAADFKNTQNVACVACLFQNKNKFHFNKKCQVYKYRFPSTLTFSTVSLSQYGCCQKGRQFLDEEAKLSEEDEGADVSSDEEDGDELNHSLDGFVVNNTHCSQGLNGTMVFPCDFNVIIK